METHHEGSDGMAVLRDTSGMRVIQGTRGNAKKDNGGDRAAEFEKLYRESYEMVFGLVMFRMCDEEAARDVVSEAYLRAARNFDKFDPSKAKFSTWVCSIARNCIVDHYRRQKKYSPIDEVSESVFAVDAQHPSQIADADLAQLLLATLDEDDREIVFMKFCEGWTNGDIARALDMNPSTVATRVQRSLEKMRAAL